MFIDEEYPKLKCLIDSLPMPLDSKYCIAFLLLAKSKCNLSIVSCENSSNVGLLSITSDKRSSKFSNDSVSFAEINLKASKSFFCPIRLTKSISVPTSAQDGLKHINAPFSRLTLKLDVCLLE